MVAAQVRRTAYGVPRSARDGPVGTVDGRRASGTLASCRRRPPALWGCAVTASRGVRDARVEPENSQAGAWAAEAEL